MFLKHILTNNKTRINILGKGCLAVLATLEIFSLRTPLVLLTLSEVEGVRTVIIPRIL